MSPSLYAIADECPEHGDAQRNARFLFCTCEHVGLGCRVCEQNALRGLASSGLAPAKRAA